MEISSVNVVSKVFFTVTKYGLVLLCFCLLTSKKLENLLDHIVGESCGVPPCPIDLRLGLKTF